jgi:hypothetical protein
MVSGYFVGVYDSGILRLPKPSILFIGIAGGYISNFGKLLAISYTGFIVSQSRFDLCKNII